MKKTLLGLGAVLALVLVLCAATIIYGMLRGQGFEQEANGWVDTELPLIVQNWDHTELLKHSSPELLKVASEADLVSLFRMLATKLGPLKSYKGAKGRVHIGITAVGFGTTATYVAKAEFSKDTAEISLVLNRNNSKWSILNFHVNSKAMLQ